MSKNKFASALGKLGKGIKKTMSPAAIRQRQDNAKARKLAAAKASAKAT